MPQMAPINWLSLFLLFFLIFMLFNMMNFFIYTPLMSSKKKMNKINTNSLNWKW
uniref:ATP synthase complex subunit 8 n=1 Tax=Graptomyza semicircularia TaxID=2992820 RepID=A0A9E7V7A0_9MUSC|nr:ATP synthase F0 subunit 8 [Graptomyza semicircularia]UZA61160.1 ATP synthase F0 subunit 8 [Graptomyza semicircularia]